MTRATRFSLPVVLPVMFVVAVLWIGRTAAAKCLSNNSLVGFRADIVMVQHQLRGSIFIVDDCTFTVSFAVLWLPMQPLMVLQSYCGFSLIIQVSALRENPLCCIFGSATLLASQVLTLHVTCFCGFVFVDESCNDVYAVVCMIHSWPSDLLLL